MMAADRVREMGYREMQTQETAFVNSSDPFSFSGLVRINGNTSRICAAFSRGAGILQTAIATGAPNQGTIDKAVKEMDDLWTQSHHVRALGVQLLDLSEHLRTLPDVTRTMTIQSEGLASDVVVTA